MQDLIIWDIAALKQRLVVGIPERHLFAYLLILISLEHISLLLPGAEWSVWMAVGDGMLFAIALLGTWAAFRRNGGAHGVRFLEKYLAIGLVVLLRFLALCVIPLGVFLGAVTEILIGVSDERTSYETVVITLFFAGYYQRVVHHMADVSATRGKLL